MIFFKLRKYFSYLISDAVSIKGLDIDMLCTKKKIKEKFTKIRSFLHLILSPLSLEGIRFL